MSYFDWSTLLASVFESTAEDALVWTVLILFGVASCGLCMIILALFCRYQSVPCPGCGFLRGRGRFSQIQEDNNGSGSVMGFDEESRDIDEDSAL